MAGKSKLVVGDRVQTNKYYEKVVSDTPRNGTILRQLYEHIWVVQLDGFPRPQHVHENYLEKVKGG